MSGRSFGHNEGEGSGPVPNSPRGRAVQGGDAFVTKINPNKGDLMYEHDEGPTSGLIYPEDLDC